MEAAVNQSSTVHLDEDSCRAFWKKHPYAYDILREHFRKAVRRGFIGLGEFAAQVKKATHQYGVSENYAPNRRTFARFNGTRDLNTMRFSPVALTLVLLTLQRIVSP